MTLPKLDTGDHVTKNKSFDLSSNQTTANDKRKSMLNTSYSSEEILMQAASSLQGLEGKQSFTNFFHTIRKVKFLSKNSILTKLQHFHEFLIQIFFGNFSREIKVVNC